MLCVHTNAHLSNAGWSSSPARICCCNVLRCAACSSPSCMMIHRAVSQVVQAARERQWSMAMAMRNLHGLRTPFPQAARCEAWSLMCRQTHCVITVSAHNCTHTLAVSQGWSDGYCCTLQVLNSTCPRVFALDSPLRPAAHETPHSRAV